MASNTHTFRHLVPSDTNPHPRLDLSNVHQDDAYSWADSALGVPAIKGLVQGWRERYKEPFKGLTTNGQLIPNLYHLSDDGGAPTQAIVTAASHLLSCTSPSQQAKFTRDIDADEWRAWANPEFYVNRNGIRLDECDEQVKRAVLDLLKASLSEEGYAKATGCMQINDFLGTLVNAKKVMNFWSYNFNMFGSPSLSEPWGFQLYGHHLCMNIFIFGSQMVISPTFQGAEPDVIDTGPKKGLTLFLPEESLGLALMQSLSPQHQEQARVFPSSHHADLPDGRYNEFDERHVAGAFQDNRVVPYEGVCVSTFTEEQKEKVVQLVGEFVKYLPQKAWERKVEEVQSHLDETWFSWYGGFGEGDTFYFRVQSPVVIVEFDHHKGIWLTNGVPVKAHIHTVVRTPNGNDYGKELLRLHREKDS